MGLRMWRVVWKINKLRLWVVRRGMVVKVDGWQEGVGMAKRGRVWKGEQRLVFLQVLDHLVHKICFGGFCSFSRSSNKASQRMTMILN